MPLTDKGQKILEGMEQEYGEKKGKEVFYASRNKGTITGVDSAKNDADSEAELRQLYKEIDKKQAERDRLQKQIDKLDDELDKMRIANVKLVRAAQKERGDSVKDDAAVLDSLATACDAYERKDAFSSGLNESGAQRWRAKAANYRAKARNARAAGEESNAKTFDEEARKCEETARRYATSRIMGDAASKLDAVIEAYDKKHDGYTPSPKIPKKLEEKLTKIANKHTGIETLKTRNSDHLDFHDVNAEGMRRALHEAYEAGRNAGSMKTKK